MAESIEFELRKLLGNIDARLASTQIEKICFLAESVLPYASVDNVSNSVHSVQQVMETHLGRNVSLVLLKRFLNNVGAIKFSTDLEPFVNEHGVVLRYPKLYFYEVIVMVIENLGRESFRRLKNLIPDSQLGVNMDRITTEIELFRRLLQKQILSDLRERESLSELKKWLECIGRSDIVVIIDQHPRISQEG